MPVQMSHASAASRAFFGATLSVPVDSAINGLRRFLAGPAGATPLGSPAEIAWQGHTMITIFRFEMADASIEVGGTDAVTVLTAAARPDPILAWERNAAEEVADLTRRFVVWAGLESSH